jgi:hypothetical protein
MSDRAVVPRTLQRRGVDGSDHEQKQSECRERRSCRGTHTVTLTDPPAARRYWARSGMTICCTDQAFPSGSLK